jgi:hypothetical protein
MRIAANPHSSATGAVGSVHRRRLRRSLMPVLACALLAGATSALAANSHGPVAGATYRGTTSEGGAVTFKLSKNGKRIQGFQTGLGYDGKCGQGGGPGFEIKAGSITIGAGGRFAASARGTFPGAGVKPITVKISGRISGASASGSVRNPSNNCEVPHKKSQLAYSETFTATAR